MSGGPPALVHVRTPTYRRPEMLRRCLTSLQGQTWRNWVCDVYDDDPDGAGRAVCAEVDDARIHYHRNEPQLYASRNIDACFTRDNPRGADYFCVVEDDNYVLPTFIEENLAICRDEGVEIVLRNQLIEHAQGTDDAHLGSLGVLDGKFEEGRYPPDLFRLSVIADIGVSNGGMFWSAKARSDLEIGVRCTAALQEYMRTYAIVEDVWVAMKPLAVWAENGDATQRNLGIAARWLRRELDLKRAQQVLRRHAWRRAGEAERRAFLANEVFAFPSRLRAAGLVKALIETRAPALTLRERLELIARGLLIRSAGRTDPDLHRFIASRGG